MKSIFLLNRGENTLDFSNTSKNLVRKRITFFWKKFNAITHTASLNGQVRGIFSGKDLRLVEKCYQDILTNSDDVEDEVNIQIRFNF